MKWSDWNTEIESFKYFPHAFTLPHNLILIWPESVRWSLVTAAWGSCPFYTFTAVINFLWRMGNLGVNKALLSNNLLCRHKPIIVSLSPDSNSTQIFSKYFLATGSGHFADRWICVTISSMSGWQARLDSAEFTPNLQIFIDVLYAK